MKRKTIKKLMIILTIILIALFSFEKINYASVPQGSTLSPTGTSTEEMKNYSVEDIYNYINNHGGFKKGTASTGGGTTSSGGVEGEKPTDEADENLKTLDKEVLEAWENTMNEAFNNDKTNVTYSNIIISINEARTGNDYNTDNGWEDAPQGNIVNGSSDDHPIYKQPQRNDNNTNSASTSLDDMMNDADDFVSSSGKVQYDQSALQNFSSSIYNILLTVGVAIAVIVGAILGVKLMLSSVEEKADTKKLLVAYAVGCLIVFGGFGIWKLIITILEGI